MTCRPPRRGRCGVAFFGRPTTLCHKSITPTQGPRFLSLSSRYRVHERRQELQINPVRPTLSGPNTASNFLSYARDAENRPDDCALQIQHSLRGIVATRQVQIHRKGPHLAISTGESSGRPAPGHGPGSTTARGRDRSTRDACLHVRISNPRAFFSEQGLTSLESRLHGPCVRSEPSTFRLPSFLSVLHHTAVSN